MCPGLYNLSLCHDRVFIGLILVKSGEVRVNWEQGLVEEGSLATPGRGFYRGSHLVIPLLVPDAKQ